MSDTETWVITGRDPVRWTIPMTVANHRKEGGVKLVDIIHAIPLNSQQQAALENFMSVQVVFSRDGKWFAIPEHELERYAKKVEGDPAYHFSWALPRQADKPEHKPERRIERDDFLQFMFNRGVGENRDHTDILWYQFCKGALDWMTNHRRPIDMHFITLHPLPYRANWKAVLTGRFPKLWRTIGRMTGAKREAFLCESGFLDEMLSLDLLAYNLTEDYVYRHVDVEHKSDWWRAVRKAELQSRDKNGLFGYAKRTMDAIKRSIPTAIKIFGSYVAQVARPCATVREGSDWGEFRFVPHIPKGGMRPTPPVVNDLNAVVLNKLPDYTKPRDPEDVRYADEGVPTVPYLRSSYEDVRKGGGDVPKPENDQSGAAGVPVLPSDEELDESELLGLDENERSNGVADGIEQPTGGT